MKTHPLTNREGTMSKATPLCMLAALIYVRFRASLIGNREFVRVIPVVYAGGP